MRTIVALFGAAGVLTEVTKSYAEGRVLEQDDVETRFAASFSHSEMRHAASLLRFLLELPRLGVFPRNVRCMVKVQQ